jgi:hypothetical protein
MEAATQGNTSGVVSRILTGLKLGVVLALDFLAKQLGLDKLVDGVQKIIQSLRRPIVSGIEWVLRKVKPFVMKVMRKPGLGGKEEPLADGTYDGQIGKVVKFSAAGEAHRLWVVQKGPDAAVMMSSVPRPVSEQLGEYQHMAEVLTDKTQQERTVGLIGQARQTLTRLDNKADTLAQDVSKPSPDSQQIERQDQAVESDEEVLAAQLAQIREALGLPPQDVSGERSAQIRSLAFEALAEELRVDHSAEETVGAVGAVATQLRPAGLLSLEIVPGSTGEEAVIHAEASRRLPLARLLRRAEGKPRFKRLVQVAAELTLAPSDESSLWVPQDRIKAENRQSGHVLPRQETRRVEVVTWNTSPTALNEDSNSSHAEHQFCTWLRRDDRRHLMARLERIVVSVHDYIPCGNCSDDLVNLMRDIVEVQGEARVLQEAHIYWWTYFSGRIKPSWQSLRLMQAHHWSLHAPINAYPPEESPTRGGLTLEEGSFWRLTGSSLAAPPQGTSQLAAGERQLEPGVIVRSGRSK